MAYTSDMRAAARRLWAVARDLPFPQQRAVAAYLFGLSAECALKAVAENLPGGKKDQIQWTHFPELRTRLRHAAGGRSWTEVRRLVESDAFMNQWAIEIRYARAEDIHGKPVDEWREHATRAMRLMEGHS